MRDYLDALDANTRRTVRRSAWMARLCLAASAVAVLCNLASAVWAGAWWSWPLLLAVLYAARSVVLSHLRLVRHADALFLATSAARHALDAEDEP